MIVAVINQTDPTGKVPVSEFKQAASAVAGRDEYIAGFTPPLPAGDWLGVDTGWSAYTPPARGNGWAWDFATSTLVQISAPGGRVLSSGFGKTLTAAPKVILAIPTNDNETYAVEVRIAARSLDVGKAFAKRVAVTFRRDTGAASLVTVATTVLYAHLEAPIAWTADVVPNLTTGDLEVTVVGAPTSPVDWWAYSDVIEV